MKTTTSILGANYHAQNEQLSKFISKQVCMPPDTTTTESAKCEF